MRIQSLVCYRVVEQKNKKTQYNCEKKIKQTMQCSEMIQSEHVTMCRERKRQKRKIGNRVTLCMIIRISSE